MFFIFEKFAQNPTIVQCLHVNRKLGTETFSLLFFFLVAVKGVLFLVAARAIFYSCVYLSLL